MLIKNKRFKILNHHEEKRGNSMADLKPTGRVYLEAQDIDDDSQNGKLFAFFDKNEHICLSSAFGLADTFYEYITRLEAEDVVYITYAFDPFARAMHIYNNAQIIIIGGEAFDEVLLKNVFIDKENTLNIRNAPVVNEWTERGKKLVDIFLEEEKKKGGNNNERFIPNSL
ncbi:MAG: hypothetical protein PHX51_08625 [Clostridia bacterium]|nr:hypothetical protein [Clostridia bacterium]